MELLAAARTCRLHRVDDDGSVWIDDGGAQRAAAVLAGIGRDELRRALAAGTPVLVLGDPPVVVGAVQGRAEAPERRVIEAARELVLRCGAGAIRIAADGTVRIEGVDVRSAARRLQRITGAQVRIN